MSASPEQILLMLYDGAIRFTRQGIKGIEENDLLQFHYGIQKSLAIITEFSNSLDHSIGGKIAEDLDALYDFMIRELTKANIRKDVEKLRVVEKLLVDLRATWGEAVETNNREQMALPGVPVPPKAPTNHAMAEDYVPFSVTR